MTTREQIESLEARVAELEDKAAKHTTLGTLHTTLLEACSERITQIEDSKIFAKVKSIPRPGWVPKVRSPFTWK